MKNDATKRNKEWVEQGTVHSTVGDVGDFQPEDLF